MELRLEACVREWRRNSIFMYSICVLNAYDMEEKGISSYVAYRFFSLDLLYIHAWPNVPRPSCRSTYKDVMGTK